MRPSGENAKPRHRLGRSRTEKSRKTAVWVAAACAVPLAAALVVVGQQAVPEAPPADRAEPRGPEVPYRAFTDSSWWNTPLPLEVPLHPHGPEILDYLRTAPESGKGCLMLAGTGETPWGQPIYWARPGDPTYDVTGPRNDRPPELDALRIPHGARAADNSDGSMTVFDRDRGYVVALTKAEYDVDSDTWTAAGATVTYLDSNGLHVRTGRSDERRNRGSHRGNNGATMAVRWDEVRAGAVRHVLKVAAGPDVAERYVFPMVGSDGDYAGDDPAVPPQGLRLRVRSDVDLERHVVDDDARVIARALQRYGMYIGDSGGTTALKLENTIAEGRGQLWGVAADALCRLPFTEEYWEVVEEGFDPTR